MNVFSGGLKVKMVIHLCAWGLVNVALVLTERGTKKIDIFCINLSAIKRKSFGFFYFSLS